MNEKTAAAVCVMDVYNGDIFLWFHSYFEPNEPVHLIKVLKNWIENK